MKGDAEYDLGPLPAVHERHVPVELARRELAEAVSAVQGKYRLTFAELLDVLAAVLRDWTSSVLSCERRRKGD